MIGINMSTMAGDAFLVPTTTGAPASFLPTPCKSVMLVIQAPTGTQFWVRQALTPGALPANSAVTAMPPDLVTTAGNVHLLDIARILDPAIGIYCSLAGNNVIAFTYHHGYTAPETASILVKTILDKILRVA